MTDEKCAPDPVAVYRRIARAEKRNQGVRLSADEVWSIMNRDEAIRGAVETADEEESQ